MHICIAAEGSACLDYSSYSDSEEGSGETGEPTLILDTRQGEDLNMDDEDFTAVEEEDCVQVVPAPAPEERKVEYEKGVDTAPAVETEPENLIIRNATHGDLGGAVLLEGGVSSEFEFVEADPESKTPEVERLDDTSAELVTEEQSMCAHSNMLEISFILFLLVFTIHYVF